MIIHFYKDGEPIFWYRALAFTSYDNPKGNAETKSGFPKNQEIFGVLVG